MRNFSVFILFIFSIHLGFSQAAIWFEPGGKFEYLPNRLYLSREIHKQPNQYPLWQNQAISETGIEYNRRNSFKEYYQNFSQKNLNQIQQQRILSEFNYKEESKWKLFHNRAMFLSWSNGRSGLYLNPILDLEIGIESEAGSEFLMWNSRGAETGITLGNKVFAYARVEEIQTYSLPYIESLYQQQYLVFPGQGRTKRFKERGYDFSRSESLIAFQPIDEVQIRMGTGKHFWGNGIRSLWLSDAGHTYPYLQIQTNLGPLTYTNLFTEFVNYQPSNNSDGAVEKKFGAFHMLNAQITKDWNFSVFEGVIHTPSANAGMFLGYLNPLMFYRTYEYHMGSADNVVIGAMTSYRITDKGQIYGQFLLDEFNLTEIRARSGWWANKWALQFGAELINVGIPNLDLKTEYNTARPYTYSHSTDIGSYSHYAQPLGHALGSNFNEWISQINYRIGPFHAQLFYMNAKQGKNNGQNMGGNILISNSDFANTYGNETLQGELHSIKHLQAKVSWEVYPEIFLDLSLINRTEEIENNPTLNSQTGLLGGFRWNGQKRTIIR